MWYRWGQLSTNVLSFFLFFLSSCEKMMTRMILWSAFSIGGDWMVNHIVSPLVCDVALFVGVGVNIFGCAWKNSIMRLIFLTVIQCEEVWGRERGLNSITRSFENIWSDYSIFFLASMKSSLLGMLTGSGNHPCSVQVVLSKGHVIVHVLRLLDKDPSWQRSKEHVKRTLRKSTQGSPHRVSRERHN